MKTVSLLAVCTSVLLLALFVAAPVQAAGLSPVFAEGVAGNAAPYGVGWGTLALINAGLAQGKNRSGLSWFLISLLLGPIATFLLVVLFRKQPEKPA